MKNIIEIDGEQYQKIEPKSNRAVIVLDRGWIFAGDVEEKDDRIYLSRVVWVFRWSSIGFAAMIEKPDSDSVDLREHRNIDLPKDVELFRVPVSNNWGLK
jgi:hypothetical protein